MLKPGGRFLFNVWDRIEENEFAKVVTDALADVLPTDPPRVLARTPHGYHDVDMILSELVEAGFRVIEIVTLEEQSMAPSPCYPAIAYCQGTPLRNAIEARDANKLGVATDRAAESSRRDMARVRFAERYKAM